MKSEDKRKGRSVKNQRTTTRRKYELDYLYDYYYNARRAEGRAPATLETYRLNYAGFCEYLDEMEIPQDIRNIDAELGRNYVMWLRYEKRRFSDKCSVSDDAKTIGLLPKSVNTRIKSMKTMFKYLAEVGVIDTANSGSYDFYRMITVLDRVGTFKEAK